MCWRKGWPSEYLNLLEEVLSQLELKALYLEKEVSGKSGARTFRAEAETDQGIANPLVLKIGDVKQIAQEQKGYTLAENNFRSFPSVRDLIVVGDLSCLVMRVAFNGRGQTLRACFNELNCDQLESLIENLFESALQVDSRYIPKTVQNPFKLYDIQTIGFVKDLRTAGDSTFTLLDWWNHAQKVSNKKGTKSFIHGDLHSKNILVKIQNQRTEISLLDFGSSGSAHAFLDYAKLERDIWLFVNNEGSDSVKTRCNKIKSALLDNKEVQQDNESIKRACKGILTIRSLVKKRKELKEIESNWEYEYLVALIWQFMLTARKSSNPIEIRRSALARAMAFKSELEEMDYALKPDKEAVRLRRMEDRAWKFAYSFLRLDQIPGRPGSQFSGGAWSRTLPMWMEALWEGEHGTVIRSPEMRVNGGVDSTGYAISILTRFWSEIFSTDSAGHEHTLYLNQMRNNLFANYPIIGNCIANLQMRVDKSGGIDIGVVGRGNPPPLRVRHSISGLLADLNCHPIHQEMMPHISAQIVEYLISNLDKWSDDKSHIFGLYASGVNLYALLDARTVFLNRYPIYEILKKKLNNVLRTIAQNLDNINFKPKPEETCPRYVPRIMGDNIQAQFFLPYYDLWRMERSSAFMFLPYLINTDGSKFLREGDLDKITTDRISDSLIQVLDEIENTYRIEDGLVSYFKSFNNSPQHRDWGLTAELLVLLEMPKIGDLLKDHGYDLQAQKKIRKLIRHSLLNTLADCAKNQHLFRFSHGLSCGAFLKTKIGSRICPEHVSKLDSFIEQTREKNCTENALFRLATVICSESMDSYEKVFELDKVQEPTKEMLPDVLSITELFVSKLEAGEHAPPLWDDKSHARTIAFFNSKEANYYLKAYHENEVHNTLLTRLVDVTGRFEDDDKVALDLGCGPGDWGKWLYEHGFEVHLLDASKNMINIAKEVMGTAVLPSKPPPKPEFHSMDAWDIDTLAIKPLSLITANALMVHIPPMKTGELLDKIFKLLKPGGRFFVNFKLRDHTLLSLDGRYFSYYRDADIPEAMLRSAGFEIHEIAFRWNDKTLYNVPKSIQWANFYCRRPLE